FEAAYGYDVRGEVLGSGGMATMGDGRRTGMVFSSASGRSVETVRSDQELLAGADVADLAAFVGRRRAGDRAGRRPVGADRPPGLDRRGRKVSAFRLAVSAEMVFLDLPFEQRVRRVADLGFEVEIWDWTPQDTDALTRTGATFSSMTGYVRGTLADPGGAEELLRTAEQSLRVAERLDCPRLNVHGTGLDDQGLPVVASDVVTPAMWLGAPPTLTPPPAVGGGARRGFPPG